MPTKNPRLHVVLNPLLYHRLKRLAKQKGLSMSLEARELIGEALTSASDHRSKKTYQGKNFGALVGKFKIPPADLDEELAKQAHG